MKKMYKSRTDSKIAGVCGGIAKFLGVDSTLVRLIVVAAVVLGGMGLWVYIVCAAIMPLEPMPDAADSEQVVDYRDHDDDGAPHNN